MTTEILSESTVIFYQIRYVMNAMIKSDKFNKIHCRSHNVNIYLMIMSAKTNSSYKILINFMRIPEHNFEHNRLVLGIMLKSIIGNSKSIIGSGLPIMLVLYLMLLVTYYALNYAGIIGLGLVATSIS